MRPYGRQWRPDVPPCDYCDKSGHSVAECWKKHMDDLADQVCLFCGKQAHGENDCWAKERIEQELLEATPQVEAANDQNVKVIREAYREETDVSE